MKTLVQEQLNTFGKQVAMDLGVDIPQIEFVDDAQYLAFTLTPVAKVFLKYESVSPATKILFCLTNIEAGCQGFNDDFKVEYVRHLIAHELRHVWQSIHNPNVLLQQFNDTAFMPVMDGYGNLPAEKDANEYAMKWATTEYSKQVFEALTLVQELADDMSPDKAKVKRVRELYVAIAKGQSKTKTSVFKKISLSLLALGGIVLATKLKKNREDGAGMQMIYAYTRIRKNNKVIEKKAAVVDGQLRYTCKETPINKTAELIALPKKDKVELEVPDFMKRWMEEKKANKTLMLAKGGEK